MIVFKGKTIMKLTRILDRACVTEERRCLCG